MNFCIVIKKNNDKKLTFNSLIKFYVVIQENN